MIRKPAIFAIMGLMLFVVSVAFSGSASAAPAKPVTQGFGQFNAASANMAERQFAQLRRRALRRTMRVVPRPAVRLHRAARIINRRRGWRGRHWGAVAYGVTLGTVIVVAANTPPPPPHGSLCWTWSNGVRTSGFWYYCNGD